jgi:outer membrane receptor protein involved in Fe transport
LSKLRLRSGQTCPAPIHRISALSMLRGVLQISGRVPLFVSLVTAALLLAIFCVPGPAFAQSQASSQIDVPAGRLSNSIRTLARQTRISIASRDAGIRRIRAKAIRGRFTPDEALSQLLAGTPYRAVAIRGGYRIERRPVTRAVSKPASPVPAKPAPPPPPPAPPIPIIVEGTKLSQTNLDYPGGVKIIQLNPGLSTSPEGYASEASLDGVLADVPAVSGTALGSGRNKIFLRGIADSSFNGPTQSTIGIYLGEQRLVYSAPNPDLKLHDVENVELLEGPQGTLYGAGTIAGLVHINPVQPDTSATSGEGWAGLGLTQDGGANWNLGGVVNLPFSENSAARVLAYSGKDSGYIDDPSRGLSDINRASHFGGRAIFAIDLSPDWNVQLAGFGQQNELKDGQYVDRTLADLQRTEKAAQPFKGRIYGGGLTVRGYLGSHELTSITSLVDHAMQSSFDSSILTDDGNSEPSIQTFSESRDIRLLSHETRLSGGNEASLSWLLGISALHNRDRTEQLIVNLNGNDPPPFAKLSYRQEEYAAFGKASYAIGPSWSLEGGGRLLYTAAKGERSFGNDTFVEPRKGPVRFLPAAALSWKPSQNWLLYSRYQNGLRTGGVAIERDSNRDPTTAQFDPDRVHSFETGLRGQLGELSPLRFRMTLFHSRWRDIQADYLNAEGFPITRNIGDGDITGLDANMEWELRNDWLLSIAGAWYDSSVERVLVSGDIADVAIPNVPTFSLQGRIAKQWTMASDDKMGAALSGRYVGKSFIDLDQLVRDEQGKYGALDLAAWWASDNLTLRFQVLNLTNSRGNRFAFGNPFTARTEDQATPMRPRTIQLSVTFKP